MPVLSAHDLAALIASRIDYATVDPGTGLPARVVAYAIARAESGGNTGIPGDGGYSIGLWQIYTIAHPQYGLAWLADPNNNATAMLEISSNGTNWRPWTMYWSHYVNAAGQTILVTPGEGPFRQFIGEAQSAFAAPQTTPPPPASQTGPTWDVLIQNEPAPSNFGALVLTALVAGGALYAVERARQREAVR